MRAEGTADVAGIAVPYPENHPGRIRKGKGKGVGKDKGKGGDVPAERRWGSRALLRAKGHGKGFRPAGGRRKRAEREAKEASVRGWVASERPTPPPSPSEENTEQGSEPDSPFRSYDTENPYVIQEWASASRQQFGIWGAKVQHARQAARAKQQTRPKPTPPTAAPSSTASQPVRSTTSGRVWRRRDVGGRTRFSLLRRRRCRYLDPCRGDADIRTHAAALPLSGCFGPGKSRGYSSTSTYKTFY